MKKEELTIGNYVNVAHQHSNMEGDYDLEFVPEKLTLEHFKFWAENDWSDTDFAIPLTTEILEKNGFKKYSNGIYKLNNKDIYIERCGKTYWVGRTAQTNEIYGEYTDRFVHVTYLHELQNALKLLRINIEIKP